MLSNVPQFIETEDHIIGPLSAKQLGWMGFGFFILFVAWQILEFTYFLVVAIPVLFLVGALCFYKPNGLPFVDFLGSSIFFVFRPKIYVWKRIPEKPRTAPKITEEQKAPQTKKLEEERLKKISELLEKGK